MKKYYLSLLLFTAAAFLLSSYSSMDIKYPQGAPAGYTGSPGDGQNCTHCHNGSLSNVQGWITSNVPPDGYIPGQTYTVTVTVSGSGSKGFEVSPQNLAGDQLGTLIAGSGSKLVGSGKYITHSSASNSNPKVWDFQWTAPAAGTGGVTMYGAFTVGKPVTKLSTLLLMENIGTGIAEGPVASEVKAYPIPAYEDLKVNFSLHNDCDVTISLVNIATGGKTLLWQGKMAAGEQARQLDCSSLSNGIYLLSIESGRMTSGTKVIIRH